MRLGQLVDDGSFALKTEATAASRSGAVIFPHGLALLVVLPAPGPCAGCGQAVRTFVNRAGRSLCMPCDVRTSGREGRP